MADIDDGGPAFPAGSSAFRGMSLRDYFAAKALPVVLTYPGQRFAEAAYAIADAMLAERKK